ncbi:MAG TPA: hypothetical protein VK525_02810 [Candidatus Saccharimonadales bacterium]|nr:hypothetical protein [Candidatus Saccharimonadales bacterium]
MPAFLRSCFAVLAATVFTLSSGLAFDHPLSDEAVREAYFLGQRRDETTANFLNKYIQHLAPPESGPYISYVSFFTPYANAVELSRQNQLGGSAQDALQEYRKHGSIVRVVITIEFTANYSFLIEKPTNSRSGSPTGYQLRSSDFWRDFSYRVFQKDQAIPPVRMEGQASFASADGVNSNLTGAVVTLYFDAESIAASDDADVVIDTTNNQQVVASFSLASLR